MDFLGFIAALVDALAWPAVVLGILLLLRREIRALLPGLSKLRVKDVVFEFHHRVRELEAQMEELEKAAPPSPVPEPIEGHGKGILPSLQGTGQGKTLAWEAEDVVARLAPISPRAAVTEAWLAVEHALVDLAELVGVDGRRSTGPLIQALADSGHLSRETVPVLNELRTLRNEAAHSQELDLTVQGALQYAKLAKQLSLRLKQEHATLEDETV